MAFVVPVIIGVSVVSGAAGLYKYMRSGTSKKPVPSMTGTLVEEIIIPPVNNIAVPEVIITPAVPIVSYPHLPDDVKHSLESFDRNSLKHVVIDDTDSTLINAIRRFKRSQLKKIVPIKMTKKTLNPFQRELNEYHRRARRTTIME